MSTAGGGGSKTWAWSTSGGPGPRAGKEGQAWRQKRKADPDSHQTVLRQQSWGLGPFTNLHTKQGASEASPTGTVTSHPDENLSALSFLLLPTHTPALCCPCLVRGWLRDISYGQVHSLMLPQSQLGNPRRKDTKNGAKGVRE